MLFSFCSQVSFFLAILVYVGLNCGVGSKFFGTFWGNFPRVIFISYFATLSGGSQDLVARWCVQEVRWRGVAGAEMCEYYLDGGIVAMVFLDDIGLIRWKVAVAAAGESSCGGDMAELVTACGGSWCISWLSLVE